MKLEKQLMKIDGRTAQNEQDILHIFDALNQLLAVEEKQNASRKKIGFKVIND